MLKRLFLSVALVLSVSLHPAYASVCGTAYTRDRIGYLRGLCAVLLIACGRAVTRPCTAATMSERLAFSARWCKSASPWVRHRRGEL